MTYWANAITENGEDLWTYTAYDTEEECLNAFDIWGKSNSIKMAWVTVNADDGTYRYNYIKTPTGWVCKNAWKMINKNDRPVE